MEPITIPVNKNKLKMHLIGALVFVALGLWFLLAPPNIDRGIFRIPYVLFTLGILCIVVFGYFGFETFKKMRDPDAFLKIDDQGITDNSSAIPAGFIPWADVQDIKQVQQNRQQLLVIAVANPQVYEARQQGWVKQKLMRANKKMYGTPVVIALNNLEGGAQAVQQAFQKYSGNLGV